VCSLVLQGEKRVGDRALPRRQVGVEQLQIHRPAMGTIIVGSRSTTATGTRDCDRYIAFDHVSVWPSRRTDRDIVAVLVVAIVLARHCS
jgi:hypothetical protein